MGGKRRIIIVNLPCSLWHENALSAQKFIITGHFYYTSSTSVIAEQKLNALMEVMARTVLSQVLPLPGSVVLENKELPCIDDILVGVCFTFRPQLTI